MGLAVALAVAVPACLYWQAHRPIYLQEQGHERTGHRYLFDPRLGWRNIPGWSGETNGKPLTINSRGMRDREYALAKPAGVTRVLVLGDSYTWGYGVANQEIYTEVLERSLAKGGAKVEVINSGVSGWGTDQEYLFLERDGIKYQPDVVVLALFLFNDPENNASSRQYGLSKPVFMDPLMTLANMPVPRPGAAEVPELISKVEALSLTVAIVRAMDALCKKHGARLVIMKFGCYPGPVPEGIVSWDRRLEAEVGWMKIPYLDLDGTMADAHVDNDLITHGNREGHWNARGHQVVAGYLEAFLERQGVLKARPR